MNILDRFFTTGRSISRRPSRKAAVRRRTLMTLESLEGRELLSTFTVTNTSDNSNPGSLRYAITEANANSNSTIKFDLTSGGTQLQDGGGYYYVIKPSTSLPTLSTAVTIDGLSQGGPNYGASGGYSTVPLIEISGANLSSSAVGLTITGSNVTVNGLSLVQFGGGGVKVSGGSHDSVSNEWIGLDPNQQSTGGGSFGVEFVAGATNGTLSDSAVADINGPGVLITGSTTMDNQIVENVIGNSPDDSGSAANQGDGVQITSGAEFNTVGGTAAGQGNVISGNVKNGVEISSAGTSHNLVEGNIIGLDSSGEDAEIPNGTNGVEIDGGATYNTIGGTSSAARNIISGNSADGVMITDAGTSDNVLQGNYIGTTSNGLSAYDVYGDRTGNVLDGVVVQTSANSNTIGGSVSGSGNLVSGNQLNGIGLNGVSNTLIEDNSIGTASNGATGLGVQQFGIIVHGSSNYNTIGGTTSIDRNLISGNTSSGVVIGNSIGASDPGTEHNLVEGNYIGTTGSGTAAIGNGWDGVIVENGATQNTIGGTASGARNVISGNTANGVAINAATDNLVEGNYIGTDKSGENSMANRGNGVVLDNGANHNTIGGTSAAARNVISGNGTNGVEMINSGTIDNLVEGDYIGTDATGLNAVGNGQDGVYIDGSATGNTIGGTVSGAGNTIAWNGGYGIVFVNNNNTQVGNNIYSNDDGSFGD